MGYTKLGLSLKVIFTESFLFFDRGNIVVLVNSFQKKSQKTPKKEINKALRIKKEYFNEKEK